MLDRPLPYHHGALRQVVRTYLNPEFGCLSRVEPCYAIEGADRVAATICPRIARTSSAFMSAMYLS